MKIRMLVSLLEMPAWMLREEGQVYDLPAPAAAAYIAGGQAVRVAGEVERAVAAEPEVSDPPIQRRRKGRG